MAGAEEELAVGAKGVVASAEGPTDAAGLKNISIDFLDFGATAGVDPDLIIIPGPTTVSGDPRADCRTNAAVPEHKSVYHI
jgi:hypothetical protein